MYLLRRWVVSPRYIFRVICTLWIFLMINQFIVYICVLRALINNCVVMPICLTHEQHHTGLLTVLYFSQSWITWSLDNDPVCSIYLVTYGKCYWGQSKSEEDIIFSSWFSSAWYWCSFGVTLIHLVHQIFSEISNWGIIHSAFAFWNVKPFQCSFIAVCGENRFIHKFKMQSLSTTLIWNSYLTMVKHSPQYSMRILSNYAFVHFLCYLRH